MDSFNTPTSTIAALEAEAVANDAPKPPSNLDSLDIETGETIAWNDPRELRNPQNWSQMSKLFHTIVPGVLAFLITFGTSVTVPATGLFMEEFGISRTVSTLPLTLYTFSIALGPLFIAPFSEVVGRKWIYMITSTCLLAFIGGASASNNLASLLVCRFFAGTLGSAGVAIGEGSIADIWRLDKTGADASLLFILSPFLGPTLGPLAGAYILKDQDYDWRWTQYLILMVGAPIWIACLLMNETSKVWILRNESSSKGPVTFKQICDIAKGALVRPTKMPSTEVVVFSLAIYAAFAYAMIFSYFSSASYILQRFYGFNLRGVGLSFISVIIGYILAMIIYSFFDHTLYARARKASPTGIADPEHRLYSAFVGSVFLPIGLFWYSWEAHEGGRWAALVAADIPFGIGAFSLFLSIIVYMVDFYGAQSAASALAANCILRYTLGAVFPLFTIQMFENLGVHWAGSVFAFASLALLPIPWLLFKYGSTIRAKSRMLNK